MQTMGEPLTSTGFGEEGGEKAAPRRVQVVDRALAALEELADAPSGLGVSELGRRLGVDKSTAHRLLGTMLARGFVRLSPYTQRYTLGLRLVGLGAVAARGVELTEIARPHLEDLRDLVREGASLAVLSEGEVLFLAKAAGPGVLTVNQGVGTRMPVHCSALGKVLLADRRETEEFDRVIAQRGLTAFTPRTLVDEAELRRHLGLVATRGWAVDDEEYALGLRCVAAPVRDANGRTVAAVGISGPATRVTLEHVETVAFHVSQAAQAISDRLGYRGQATDLGVVRE
jgi:IclR family transcriptional regulator, KDG regulon repressor